MLNKKTATQQGVKAEQVGTYINLQSSLSPSLFLTRPNGWDFISASASQTL